jgi:hypothetical protein
MKSNKGLKQYDVQLLEEENKSAIEAEERKRAQKKRQMKLLWRIGEKK